MLKKKFCGLLCGVVIAAMTAASGISMAHAGLLGGTPGILFEEAPVDENRPAADDHASLTVYGIDDENAQVTAYQIIEAEYNKYGLTGYVQNAESKAISEIVDFSEVTEKNVSELAGALYSGKLNFSDESMVVKLTRRTNGSFKADGTAGSGTVKAGSYIVLVKSENTGVIYNPMIISNFYTDSTDKTSLGGDDLVLEGDDGILKMALQGRAYAKKDTVILNKYIVNSSTNHDNGKLDYCKYDDAAENDDLMFDVVTEIPDYSDVYFANDADFVFELYDHYSEGLAFVERENIKVYYASSVLHEPEDIAVDIIKPENVLAAENYTVSTGMLENEGGYFKIDFKKDFVTAEENAGKKIIVRYTTKLDNDAIKGLEGNPNDVKLTYTTVPGESWNKYAGTTHYTFPVIIGKIDESGEVLEYSGEVKEDYDISGYLKKPVAGAKFILKKVSDRNGDVPETESATYYMTSDEKGVIRFDEEPADGIDEGTYSLTEYEAPKGYALNDKVYTVIIAAEYESDRKYENSKDKNDGEVSKAEHRFIKSYSIKITDGAADNNASKYSWLDVSGGVIEAEIVPSAIPNTKLTRLPAAGSRGGLVLTVCGVGIMGVAISGAILINKKKKK